ncbi:RNA polymerase I-specific transcription initiation factor RRN3-domain-containing protein, partial [Jimgerdemannia flammicorona]
CTPTIHGSALADLPAGASCVAVRALSDPDKPDGSVPRVGGRVPAQARVVACANCVPTQPAPRRRVEIQVELEELEEEESEIGVFNWDLNGNAPTQPMNPADLFETAPEADIHTDDSSDSDAELTDSGSDSDSGTSPNISVLNIKDMIRKLDSMLCLVFEYIERTTLSPTVPNGDIYENRKPRDEMLMILLDIFDRTILQTFKSRYTQFLLFYYCAIDAPTFPDAFLGHLVAKLIDQAHPAVTRIASAAYISSFVSRARYLNTECIRTVVQYLGGWCHEYMDKYEGNVVTPDQTKYGVFYAVVQAMMYVFCFRWKVLMEEGDEITGESEMERVKGAGGVIGKRWCAGLSGMQRMLDKL